MHFRLTALPLLAAGILSGLVASAQTTASEDVRTVADARVLEVFALSSVPADGVVLSGGLRAGWREGMQAVVRRGGLEVAELTVVSSNGRVSVALIDRLASDVRIGAGDTVSVKIQKL